MVCLAQIGAIKIFSWVFPLIDVRHCCKLSWHPNLRKTWSNFNKIVKNLILGLIRPIRPKFVLPNFFSKIWFRQSLDIMVNYHHVQYQKKLMIQPWENLVMDGRTDRQMDKNEFIRRCPINIEHPKMRKFFKKRENFFALAKFCRHNLSHLAISLSIYISTCHMPTWIAKVDWELSANILNW